MKSALHTIKFIMMDAFKDFFAGDKDDFNLDPRIKLEVEREIAIINIKRIIPLTVLIIFVEIGNTVGVAYRLFSKPNMPLFVGASIYLFLLSFAYILITGSVLYKNEESINRLKLIYRSFWLLFSLGIILISAVEIVNVNIFNNYIFFFVLISVVPLLTLKEVSMVIFPNLIIVIPFLIYNQADIKLMEEIITINLAAIILSQVLQRKYLSIVTSKKRLEIVNAKLETMAETDELTSLFNRRGLENKVNILWPYCIRNKTNVAAIMLDIDFFKDVNDTYGHAVGDNCLRSIARCLTMSVRRVTDVVARVGGEEFIIFLYDVEREDVLNLAYKIRSNINDLELKAANQSMSEFITVSMGINTMIPTIYNRADELYRRADEALYEAKGNGRDCMVFNRKVYR